MSLNNSFERQSDQGSDNWLRDRAGHATASCFADILAVSKRDNKPLKARDDYLMKLVVERITGEPVESAASFSMQWGTDCEPYARAEYEMQTGNIVREVGFMKSQIHSWLGASSDGLVGADGGIEIKCPHNSAVHLKTWRDGMPEEHIPQVQGQMFVLGLQWTDFCSYDPRMPANLKLYVQRVQRDEAYIKDLENQILNFLAEVNIEVESFLNLKKAA